MEQEQIINNVPPQEPNNQEPIIEQPKKKAFNYKVYCIAAIIIMFCAVIGMLHEHIDKEKLKSENLKLQSNEIGLQLCNDGFTKSIAVVSQCKKYIGTVSDGMKFNYNGETNISRMDQTNLPFGQETIYIKLLDDVLFER